VLVPDEILLLITAFFSIHRTRPKPLIALPRPETRKTESSRDTTPAPSIAPRQAPIIALAEAEPKQEPYTTITAAAPKYLFA
jgi:hypothetical protein